MKKRADTHPMERTMRSGTSIFLAIWSNSALGSTDTTNPRISFPAWFMRRTERPLSPTVSQSWLRFIGNQVNFPTKNTEGET